jgi:hypothetical protein
MRHLSSYLCLNIGWGAFWQVFSCLGLPSGGRKSDPDALDRALIELEGGLPVDHHDDAQFFLAVGTEGPGESWCTAQANIVFTQPADHALDQPALSRFEVAEEEKTAAAFDVDDLSSSHNEKHLAQSGRGSQAENP